MKRLWTLTWAIALTLLLSATAYAAESGPTYTDVTGSEYYAEAVEVLSDAGILTGYADGSFRADRLVTRAEMTAVVCRMIGEGGGEAAAGKSAFPDVAAEFWAAGCISLARDKGIVCGDGSGLFRPAAPVKYQEAVKMAVCALGLEDSVEADPADWSAGYLALAADKHITENLNAQKGQALTRGDVAVLVYNALYRSGIGLEDFEVDRWLKIGRVGIDYNTTHSSEYSICISTEQRNAFSLHRTYPVKPDTYYIASAYVKTENLASVERDDVGVCISADIPINDSNNGSTLSLDLRGDQDWTKLTLLLYSADAAELTVSLNYGYYGNSCTGKVYFDDISLEEYTAPSTSEWKMLFVILPNSEIPLIDEDGREYIGREGISAQEIEDIQEAVQLFQEDAYEDSGGRLRVSTETIIIDKPITCLRDTGDKDLGYTLYTQDAYELIKDEVDIDEYDHITVFGNLNLPGRPGYYGLAFSNSSYLPFHQGTGYTIVNTQVSDFSEKTAWRPALIMHEFLHYMEDWARMLNQGLPFEIDKVEEYGYQRDEGIYKEWRKFYIDVMNHNVPLENGERAGIPDSLWNVTPKEFRFLRINFNYKD